MKTTGGKKKKDYKIQIFNKITLTNFALFKTFWGASDYQSENQRRYYPTKRHLSSVAHFSCISTSLQVCKTIRIPLEIGLF